MTKKEKEKLVLIYKVLSVAHQCCACGLGETPFVPTKENDEPKQVLYGRAARYEAELQRLMGEK